MAANISSNLTTLQKDNRRDGGARSRGTMNTGRPSFSPTFIPPPFNRRFFLFPSFPLCYIERRSHEFLHLLIRGTCQRPRVLRVGKPRGRSTTWLPQSGSNRLVCTHGGCETYVRVLILLFFERCICISFYKDARFICCKILCHSYIEIYMSHKAIYINVKF